MLGPFKYWTTVTRPDKSGIWIVQTCLTNSGLKTRQKISVLWSKMSNIQMVHLIMWSDYLKTGQKSVQKVECSDCG